MVSTWKRQSLSVATHLMQLLLQPIHGHCHPACVVLSHLSQTGILAPVATISGWPTHDSSLAQIRWIALGGAKKVVLSRGCGSSPRVPMCVPMVHEGCELAAAQQFTSEARRVHERQCLWAFKPDSNHETYRASRHEFGTTPSAQPYSSSLHA